jgi:hypothetical protein
MQSFNRTTASPRLVAGARHYHDLGPISMTDDAALSWGGLRRALRALPRERRRALVRAVREGRAVDDPRDAALAVAWARRIQVARWVGWALPKTRPQGRRAILWMAHGMWVILTLVVAVVFAWQSLGVMRWIVVGVFAYGVFSVPWVLRLVLQTRWNAPEAERVNRELLVLNSER